MPRSPSFLDMMPEEYRRCGGAAEALFRQVIKAVARLRPARSGICYD